MGRSPAHRVPKSVGGVAVRTMDMEFWSGRGGTCDQSIVREVLQGLNINDCVRIRKKPFNYVENKGNCVVLSDETYNIDEFKFTESGQLMFRLSNQQRWFFRSELIQMGPESAVSELQNQRANLRQDLSRHLSSTMKSLAGPSFDERMKEAVQRFARKSQAVEKEQRRSLQEAVERGRSRPPCAVVRPKEEEPDPQARLLERKKKMQENQKAYLDQLAVINHRTEAREPIFKLSEVQAAFEMLSSQQEKRKREIQQKEREGWQQICSLEKAAFKRPLLIEDYNYKPPRHNESAPDLHASEGIIRPQSAPNKLMLSKTSPSRTRQNYKAPWC